MPVADARSRMSGRSVLQAALMDTGDYWNVWVRDVTDTDVIFDAGGDLWAAPYTLVPSIPDALGAVAIGDAVKIRLVA